MQIRIANTTDAEGIANVHVNSWKTSDHKALRQVYIRMPIYYDGDIPGRVIDIPCRTIGGHI